MLRSHRSYPSVEYRCSSRADVTQVSGTGIKYRYQFFVQNHNGLFCRELRPYRTTSARQASPVYCIIPLPKCWVPVLRYRFTEVPDTGIKISRSYRTYRGVGYRCRRRTEHTEFSGIEFVANLTGAVGRVTWPYRTLRSGWVGYLPSEYPGYTLLRTLPNLPLEIYI